MNPLFILFIVISIFAGLFFSLYILLKFLFLSVQENIYGNFGEAIFSSPPGISGQDIGIVFISLLFASTISVIIIILGAAWEIKKKQKIRRH